VGVGEANGRDPTPPVGLDRRKHVARTGVRRCCSVRGQCLRDRESVGCDGLVSEPGDWPRQDSVAHLVDCPRGNDEQSPLVNIGANQDGRLGISRDFALRENEPETIRNSPKRSGNSPNCEWPTCALIPQSGLQQARTRSDRQQARLLIFDQGDT
jgi:hypothetical protein